MACFLLPFTHPLPYTGEANASFCPHANGCRDVLVSEGQILLDVTDHQVFLTVQIPAGKTLWLVSVQRRSTGSYIMPHPKLFQFIFLVRHYSIIIDLKTQIHPPPLHSSSS